MKWTIKKKLLTGFGLILVLMIVLGINSFYTNNEMEQMTFQLEEESENIIYFLEQEINHMYWLNSLADSILLAEDFTGELDYTACEFGERYYAILESEEFEDYSEEVQRLLLNMEEPHRLLHESAAEIVEIHNEYGFDSEEGYEQALQIYYQQTQQHVADLQAYFAEIKEYFEQEKAAHLVHVQERSTFMNRVIILLTILAIGVALVVGFLLDKNISEPAQQAVDFAEKISQGNLKAELLELESKDEIADLVHALNEMKTQLHKMVVNLLESIEGLSSYSQELLALTEEGDVFIEMSNANVEEMDSSIQEISSSSQEIAEFAHEADSQTKLGHQNIEDAAQSMEEINQSVSKAVQVISELDSDSEEIGKIVDLINDIAEQTNLLALNAAIEAANAGEHGLGFAVVAEEVRELAEETAQATGDINQLINRVQRKSKVGVETVKEVQIKSKQGKEVVEETGEIFRRIRESISDTSSYVEETAASAADVAEGSQQVLHSSQEIENMISEISNSAEELAEMAQQLNELIDIFEV
ncbi:methyl-accepting chemotaxis protein [Fuchsiella alkaliacetigena]|uniref:methyl-accepting chemotaxis protein n=1 Tax=Fuchsiella alkaliacetigena TaxID=957042 RepID=UPI00200ACA64|nr:methyl-accepting chemotaxis protein [Fuchsiella alkaliacetigena]MCK8823588.1 methyl-accepting chemotaxis protein [Fuchsiella alkaliacetigena]